MAKKKPEVLHQTHYEKPKGVIQPVTLAEPSFLYQLDALCEEGGNNLWSGNLQPNNGHDPKHAIKAAKLFAAAEDMLAALKQIVKFENRENNEWDAVERVIPEIMKRARAAIAKAES